MNLDKLFQNLSKSVALFIPEEIH